MAHMLSITPLGRIALQSNIFKVRRHTIILSTLAIETKPQPIHTIVSEVRRQRNSDLSDKIIAHDILHLLQYNFVRVHG